MELILEYGIIIVLYFQGLGDWIIPIMQLVTFLGNETFYLLVAPVLLWCIQAELGLRLGIYLMISGGINTILKLVLHGPRPYWLDPSVKALSTETSFGMPSGHAQNAVVVWGTIAAYLNRTWAWILAVFLIFLIGISRIHLGVHFPSDVIAGWVFGALLLWILLKIEKPILTWLTSFKPGKQYAVVFGASIFLIFLGYLAKLSLAIWSLPLEWVQNASITAPEADPITPLSLSGLISNAGAFFGLAAGAIWLWRQGGFNAGGPIVRRILRYLIGVIGIIILWLGLRSVFPGGDSMLAYTLRYLRYGMIGFWLTGLGPRLFIRLNLAEHKSSEA
jgi:membrane-associated phospholipid phosphatase